MLKVATLFLQPYEFHSRILFPFNRNSYNAFRLLLIMSRSKFPACQIVYGLYISPEKNRPTEVYHVIYRAAL